MTEELFPAGNGVVLAKDLTPNSIAEAAIPVLTDSRLASSLGEAAHNRVQTTFLEEHFATRFCRTLGQALQIDFPFGNCSRNTTMLRAL